MDRPDAERLYDSGKEPTVEKLLELDQKVQELEEKVKSLTTNSSNSSKPPSSDGPEVPRKKKARSGKAPGGQPGQPGKNRPLLAVEEMDRVKELYPPLCEQCGNLLDVATCPETSKPWRHQVFELPKIEPIKTEFRCHELQCSCGHLTRAPLPESVRHSSFGPRVHAAIGYLASVHRGTRRGIAEIMQTLFNLDISVGTVCNAIDRVSQACEPPVRELAEKLHSETVLNIDETGWKSKGDRRWLWVFVTPLIVLFRVASCRASRVLSETLGASFSGVIVSDDHSAYSAYHKGLRQLCWAHLIRKLKALKDTRGSPDSYRFAKATLHEIGRLFSYWHAFRKGGLSRQELWLATALIRGRMKALCNHYRNSSDSAVRTRAKRFLKNWDYLFNFLRHEGVEPTNNSAERALRPAVQWRKICFGSQSQDGERFTERILTVTRTCQLQNKNAFEFLAQLMDAHFQKCPLPSLIPGA
jgi:transposase